MNLARGGLFLHVIPSLISNIWGSEVTNTIQFKIANILSLFSLHFHTFPPSEYIAHLFYDFMIDCIVEPLHRAGGQEGCLPRRGGWGQQQSPATEPRADQRGHHHHVLEGYAAHVGPRGP